MGLLLQIFEVARNRALNDSHFLSWAAFRDAAFFVG